ncbi:RtcB family protein [Planctomicrobium piriforme]|uniref:3'-phosphate/5'-hydroxy nucleic acid ligase n=1 Tax=Planctomicrobium piriforme TaxID=1576369 RepID=A0A1I3IMK7_9PLAN|nr:RtcB family protein [Planctomicrobium piriforme]SFI49120.1 tRNA-splicing ligase RtcB [Planctomicrobium piriforme]
MTTPSSLFTCLAEPLLPEVVESVDRLRRADDVIYVALMPDVHLAAEVCVGSVVATRKRIYPAAVGSDIGCGMAAVAVQCDATLLENERAAASLLANLYQQVPANKHRSRQPLPAALSERELSDRRLNKLAQRDGCIQLGTLGRGNHFLEFQADEQGGLWVMVHSGSRSMGQAITAHHLQQCDGASQGLKSLSAETSSGLAYLSDVEWARTYAAENRLAMLRAVDCILQSSFSTALDWETLIHTDHDHVQLESHFGQDVWVHRKGAQPAALGQPGIIPGSMGAPSYHVVGRGCAESLMSCSHGAGRRLSRFAARRTISSRELERQVRGLWYDHRRTEQLRDEAPSSYKDIEDIMRAQKNLVRIVRKLQPVLSYKGV